MPFTQTRAGRAFSTLFAALAVGLFALATTPSTAAALTITFDGLDHGDVVTGFDGITISADNPRFHDPADDYAVAFDSDFDGQTEDPDLEYAWDGGNLVGVPLGRILIVQENTAGCSTGRCTRPDDEGSRPAGTLTFEFGVATPFIGFDLIDVDSTMAENGAITLTDGEGATATIDFASVLSGFDIGDNTANRIEPIFAARHGLEDIVSAELLMGGSGAIDNVEYGVAPEPATAVLMGVGLIGLGYAGRRRT